MGYLRKGTGVFELNDSDKYCGSFINIEDVERIYRGDKSEDVDLSGLTFTDGRIDELDLHKSKEHITSRKGGLDTFILEALIKQLDPFANIEHKVRWKGRNEVDMIVQYKGREFYIDFVSPHDFDYRRDGSVPESPIIKKHKVEEATGLTCYIWPFWIQRCIKNLQILLGEDGGIGWGALWTSTFLFGRFPQPDAASMIEELSAPFNAKHKDGYGYMLEKCDDSLKQKSAHPVIGEILRGNKSRSILIPNGSRDDEMWLPSVLR